MEQIGPEFYQRVLLIAVTHAYYNLIKYQSLADKPSFHCYRNQSCLTQSHRHEI